MSLSLRPGVDSCPEGGSTVFFEDMLKCEIIEAFKQCGYRELDRVEIEVDGHDVTLRGTLPSYFLRQKAAALVLSNPSVATLQSMIDVALAPLPR